MRDLRYRWYMLFASVLLAWACNDGRRTEASFEGPPPPDREATAPSPAPAATSGKVKIKDGSGATAFAVKPKDDGAKVLDASGAELLRIKIQDAQKIKIKGPDETVLGYVKGDREEFRVKDATQGVTYFKLERQIDGDYKLVDSGDVTILKLKRRDYGWVARDPTEKDLFKVKLKDGKTSLRDASDRTLYSTKDPVHALAFACLGLEELTPAQRFGLYVQVSRVAP